MFDILCFHQEEERKNKKIKKIKEFCTMNPKRCPTPMTGNASPAVGSAKYMQPRAFVPVLLCTCALKHTLNTLSLPAGNETSACMSI